MIIIPVQYAALTCDLVGSKQLSSKEREAVQMHLRQAVARLQVEFPNVVGANAFEFRFGDEWQIVLTRSSQAYTVYTYLYYLLSDHPFYCGIGVGPISTPFSGNSHELDGPALHLAREALIQAKEASRPVVIRLFQTDDWGNEMEGLAQSVADLIHRFRTGRRPSQVAATREAVLNNETATDLARKLGIGRTSARRRLQTSGLDEEMDAVKSLERVLEWSARYLVHR